MTTKVVTRAQNGILLAVSDDGHWWAIDGASQVRLIDEPRAGLVFLEEPPAPEIVAATISGAKPFPLSALLQAAVAGKSAYWVERALSWHETNQSLGSREEFATVATLAWISQGVRHRMRMLKR
jgi:hypothetical protein